METARTAQFRNGAVGGGHIAESARLASHRYPPPRGRGLLRRMGAWMGGRQSTIF